MNEYNSQILTERIKSRIQKHFGTEYKLGKSTVESISLREERPNKFMIYDFVGGSMTNSFIEGTLLDIGNMQVSQFSGLIDICIDLSKLSNIAYWNYTPFSTYVRLIDGKIENREDLFLSENTNNVNPQEIFPDRLFIQDY